ncbi:MAG TPA: putative PEP-binding protein, partial [Methylomirabilota bacterium]|nr:putative PEP-binding protein [Methylomirabilota bacterium]
TPELTALMGWADQFRRLRVRANADTPHDAKVARMFGAEGIGLCRTEHMFFEGDRIDAVREMILAEDTAGRSRALEKIVPMQKSDFIGILREMAALPVTIRLLDPPLHEFLPHTEAEIADLANKLGVSAERLRTKRNALHEFNPMLGHRGCRLGITFPEIYEAQARAIMEAACELTREGVRVIPEIMIPLVGYKGELDILRERIIKICTEVTQRIGVAVPYTVGTMIEVPRAALVADAIAATAEFFSFGTNDLTQMTLGLSRDDAGKFLAEYLQQGIFSQDPFISLDQTGVGQLIDMAVKRGRAVRPSLKVGICGEHGGDPASIEFCHSADLDYVSCSPYRVPIARLAAAHAALRQQPAVKVRRSRRKVKEEPALAAALA